MLRGLLCTLVLCGPAYADPLRIGTEPDYWPYIYLNHSGARAGFDVDLMDLLCTRGGYECDWVEVPFDQIITGVAEGQFDVSIGGIGTSPRRDALVDWTRPYRAIEVGHSYFAALSASVDLTSARIAVQSGTIMEDVLRENGYQAIPYPSNSAAIEAVLTGAVEAVLTSASALTQTARTQTARAGAQLVELGYLTNPGPGPQIAVPKTNPALREHLNALIEALDKDGSLTVLNAIWFPQGNEAEL